MFQQKVDSLAEAMLIEKGKLIYRERMKCEERFEAESANQSAKEKLQSFADARREFQEARVLIELESFRNEEKARERHMFETLNKLFIIAQRQESELLNVHDSDLKKVESEIENEESDYIRAITERETAAIHTELQYPSIIDNRTLYKTTAEARLKEKIETARSKFAEKKLRDISKMRAQHTQELDQHFERTCKDARYFLTNAQVRTRERQRIYLTLTGLLFSTPMISLAL